MENDFGYLFDLIVALRAHGVPITALDLNCFTAEEQKWIALGYELEFSQLEKTA